MDPRTNRRRITTLTDVIKELEMTRSGAQAEIEAFQAQITLEEKKIVTLKEANPHATPRLQLITIQDLESKIKANQLLIDEIPAQIADCENRISLAKVDCLEFEANLLEKEVLCRAKEQTRLLEALQTFEDCAFIPVSLIRRESAPPLTQRKADLVRFYRQAAQALRAGQPVFNPINPNTGQPNWKVPDYFPGGKI